MKNIDFSQLSKAIIGVAVGAILGAFGYEKVAEQPNTAEASETVKTSGGRNNQNKTDGSGNIGNIDASGTGNSIVNSPNNFKDIETQIQNPVYQPDADIDGVINNNPNCQGENSCSQGEINRVKLLEKFCQGKECTDDFQSRLENSVLKQHELRGINIPGTRIINGKLNYFNAPEIKLANSLLEDSQLRGAYFGGANQTTQTSLISSVSFNGSNFTCIKSFGSKRTDFTFASINQTSFDNTDFSCNDLEENNQENNRSTFYKSTIYDTSFKQANLQRVNFSEVESKNLIFINADLSQAILYKSTLINANLAESNLTEANLVDSNLEGANLSMANLNNADLWGANLNNAIVDIDRTNISSKQIKSTCNWELALYKGKWINGDYIVNLEANKVYINQLKGKTELGSPNLDLCSRFG